MTGGWSATTGKRRRSEGVDDEGSPAAHSLGEEAEDDRTGMAKTKEASARQEALRDGADFLPEHSAVTKTAKHGAAAHRWHSGLEMWRPRMVKAWEDVGAGAEARGCPVAAGDEEEEEAEKVRRRRGSPTAHSTDGGAEDDLRGTRKAEVSSLRHGRDWGGGDFSPEDLRRRGQRTVPRLSSTRGEKLVEGKGKTADGDPWEWFYRARGGETAGGYSPE